VFCIDVNEASLQKAEDTAANWLSGRLSKGKISAKQADAIKKRLNFTGNREMVAKVTDLVIKAAIEILKVKQQILANLDEICPPHAILAANSSYTVSSKIADAA